MFFFYNTIAGKMRPEFLKAGKGERPSGEIFTPDELWQNPVVFDRIIQLYQEIYGEPPWNEGAYCSGNCGWGSLIPLSRFKNDGEQANCGICNHPMIPCYPQEGLKRLLSEQLRNGEGVCVTMAREGVGVVGFCMGGLLRSREELSSYLDHYFGYRRLVVPNEMLSFAEDKASFPLVVVYDLVKDKGARGDLGETAWLLSPIFELALEGNLLNILRNSFGSAMLTSKETVTFRYAKSMGYKSVASGNDTELMYLPDARNLTILLLTTRNNRLLRSIVGRRSR